MKKHRDKDDGDEAAYIYHKSETFATIKKWLLEEGNLDTETGAMSQMRGTGIVKTVIQGMKALKFEKNKNSHKFVRNEMVQAANVRAIIMLVWFAVMACEKGQKGQGIMDPLFMTQKYVKSSYSLVCKIQNHYGMVILGFSVIGRAIERTVQSDDVFGNFMNGGEERQYPAYNPMTTKEILEAYAKCPATLKLNGEGKGEKRGASYGSQVVAAHHRYKCVENMMTNKHRLKNAREDSQAHRTICRNLMTMLVMCIASTHPFRGIELCSFSWMDINERVYYPDGSFVDIPLLVRCLLPSHIKLPPVKYYYISHYCSKGKALDAHEQKMMHAVPEFASLMSLPVVFEFVTRIILDIAPHMILSPIKNPLGLMIYKVKQSLKKGMHAEFLPTGTLGTWLKMHASIPEGAIANAWIMPYSCRITFARLIKSMGFLTQCDDDIRAELYRMFGHVFGSMVILDDYGCQTNTTQAAWWNYLTELAEMDL